MRTALNDLPQGSDLGEHWALDPEIVFLNHGSFGACPTEVLTVQHEFRARMEAEPVRFFIHELPDLLDEARVRLADYLAADTDGLAFVANATTGVNTALAAIPLEKDDEILVTNHGYPACRNAVDVVVRRARVDVVEAAVPFPISSPKLVVEAVLGGLSSRTRVVVIDHVTSPTGLVFPIRDLVTELEERGITVIVDGAHAPGMVELGLNALGASFYTGNCHKWLCAPKGAAFLWVRDDWRTRTHPLVTSHGATAPLGERSRFHLEFDWTGTGDPSAWLSVPAALKTVGAMLPGGWPEVRSRNRRLAIEALNHLCSTLDLPHPCPDEMIGSLAAIPLPFPGSEHSLPIGDIDHLQKRLFREFSVEVPVTIWSNPPRWAIRISAHLYNSSDQYRYLASALRETMGELPSPSLRD